MRTSTSGSADAERIPGGAPIKHALASTAAAIHLVGPDFSLKRWIMLLSLSAEHRVLGCRILRATLMPCVEWGLTASARKAHRGD
jgi:hypothetical protein